ncbi:MAG: hypothetical protein QOG42_273 [Solirubrobacteraceae bacterium]|nr:hypothetical protein [Solirubrobacteraceae bacterium]
MSDADATHLLRQAWETRSRDLVETRVGLAQAIAALTDELDARRRQAEAAQAEIAALREHAERDRRALDELTAQLQRAHAELALLRRPGRSSHAANARRLIGRIRRILR